MSKFSKYTDDELTMLLKQGDQGAFTEIYERYFWLLHSHAYKWMRNRSETKDIIHELFSALWAKRDTLDLDGRLAPYLYASVRNRIFNHIAREKHAVRYLPSLEEFLENGECLTDHAIREKLLMEIIEAGIAEMPRKMREVFELSRKGQFSHREIAEKLDISEETVKKHIHHALKLLRPRVEMIIVIFPLIHR